MNSILAKYLQHVHRLCPRLSEAELAVFGSGLSVQTLPRKALFRRAGEQADSMAYVVNGLLKAYYVDEAGNAVNINFLREGMYAGDYLAFAQQRPSRYDFQCLEFCTLVLLPHAHLHDCQQHIPAIEGYLRQMIETAFIAYLQRTENLLSTDAEQRYRHFLATQPDLVRRISLSDLCSYLGMQRQTLTRIRQKINQQN